ncbi:MAG: PDZ domain-containing protein, partial [Planctomycetota bacterium]
MEKKSERLQRWMYGLWVLVWAVSLTAVTPGARAYPEGPTTTDSRIATQIASLLGDDHLLQQPLDDRMSHRFLENYIEAFDRTRLYFYQSDIHEFQKMDTALDDLIKRGDIKFAFVVYNRFIERLEERVSYIEKLLAQEQDFSVKEYVDLDREDAPWPSDIAEVEELWRQRIKYLLLNLEAEGETADEAVERLQKRYRNFLRRMKQMDNDELLQMYLTSLSMGFDPHTTYMSPGTLEDFNISMRLELEGIGARLQEEDGYTIVHEVLKGGAADKHGLLRAKDKIIGVAQGQGGEEQSDDFVDVVDMKLSDTVKLIRGAKGSFVRLKVVTGIDKEQKVYTIKRAKVELKESEAHGEIFEDDFGGGVMKVGVIDLPR